MQRFQQYLFIIIYAVVLAGCRTVPRQPTETIPSTIRVMSYNIRAGAGSERPLAGQLRKGQLNLIAQFIRDSGADIILLQEVDKGTERGNRMNQAEYLAGQLGFHYAFSPAIDLQGGKYGLATLSRWPIADTETVKLFQPDYSQTNPNYPSWYSEQRIAQKIDIEFQGAKVTAINTHLGITEDQREKQFQQIAELVEENNNGQMIVLGGDFNAQPDEGTMTPIRSRLRDSIAKEEATIPSFPAIEPNRRIDYIFVNFIANIKTSEVLPIELSDHRPLLVEIDLDMTPQ